MTIMNAHANPDSPLSLLGKRVDIPQDPNPITARGRELDLKEMQGWEKSLNNSYSAQRRYAMPRKNKQKPASS